MGEHPIKTLFLDRDGVVNPLVLNPQTGEYESPHALEDFQVYPWVSPSLKTLQAQGFQFFLLTNQPSYAKKKVSLETLKAIRERLSQFWRDEGLNFVEEYYCFHHPQSLREELKIKCQCRKPGTLFLQQALDKHLIDREQMWFVGDQDTDIECGQKMNCRTLLVENPDSHKKRGRSQPDFRVRDLAEACEVIGSDPRR